jgi:ATP-dependent Clp protease ATP-binding subunit ClpC
MTWKELEIKLEPWKMVVCLEGVLRHRTRRVLQTIFLFLSVVSFALASGVLFSPSPNLTGLFFVFLFFFLLIFLLESFFYSNVFRSEDGKLEFGFELASLVFDASNHDLTKSFAFSPVGSIIFTRLGLDGGDVRDFLRRRLKKLNAKEVTLPDSKTLLDSFLSTIFATDREFQTFLLAHNVTEEIFLGCSRWVISSLRGEIKGERWWNRESLSRIEPIGKDWSYGKSYFLDRFSDPLNMTIPPGVEYHKEDALTLGVILSKSREANALIVGEEGVGKIEVIETLLQSIEDGKATPALKHKRFLVLDTAVFISAMENKEVLEEAILKVFKEAESAGNIVLIIPDFSSLIRDAQNLGSNMPTLMDRFLASSSVQVIAIANTPEFHAIIEKNQALMQRFSPIIIRGEEAGQILSILERSIAGLENSEGVFFTYQAIHGAVKSAERYFVGSPLLEKSLDIMIEAAARAKENERRAVLESDVESLIASQTGIPTGKISHDEQWRLENLEELLHHRIVGQNEAIKAISNALRRTRAGIGNPNRPIGSFLFFGPTGVGKTETTKALAEIFFGPQNNSAYVAGHGEERILRLDMSEYNTPDALNRLIGSISGESGILGSMLRDNPYGVLLLDEFEKTEETVLDLFLQILDEGVFSDAAGRKVSARNTIIIATSNAGSDLIFKAMERGEGLEGEKDKVISEIVGRGIFKPELLNRFDGIILFHPLSREHLRNVARLMLERLAWRLKAQGISIDINEDLISFLVEKGLDPKFGARSLNRAVQETVEKVIADKIIAGELRPGSVASLSKEDLER